MGPGDEAKGQGGGPGRGRGEGPGWGAGAGGRARAGVGGQGGVRECTFLFFFPLVLSNVNIFVGLVVSYGVTATWITVNLASLINSRMECLTANLTHKFLRLFAVTNHHPNIA